MFAFYKLDDGSIVSVVRASSMPDAPDGYGYVDYQHEVSDTHKYHVVNGVLTPKPQSDVDDFEIQVAAKRLRRKRDQMLSSCDWTQASDSPLSSLKRVEWATYRQELRDLPANTDDPRYPNYPSTPT